MNSSTISFNIVVYSQATNITNVECKVVCLVHFYFDRYLIYVLHMVFYIVIRIFLRGIVDTGTREHGIRCKHSCLYTTNTLNNWKGRTFIFYTTPQKVGPLGRCKGISGQALGLPPQTIPNYCMTFSMDISHSST